jgi:hypothetical protein
MQAIFNGMTMVAKVGGDWGQSYISGSIYYLDK